MTPSEQSVPEITDDLITALLRDQFPDLAGQDIGRYYQLEDHVTVRIGDQWGARLPLRAEQDALYARSTELIAPHLRRWTFPSSPPLRAGDPGSGFPFHFEIVPWISASTAGFVPLRASEAAALGDALRQVHRPAPDDAPLNPRSSLALADLEAEWTLLLGHAVAKGAPEQRVLLADATDHAWRSAVAAGGRVRFTWTHGELEPRSILSDQGRFAGVVMWHNFGAGDPAMDLGYCQVLLPRDAKSELVKAHGHVHRGMHQRADAWQLLAALRFIALDEPFLSRLAWERLIELDLVEVA